jgi:hypothetical protein
MEEKIAKFSQGLWLTLSICKFYIKSQRLSEFAMGRGCRDMGCAMWRGRRGVGDST